MKGMATHSGILAWRIPWTGDLAGYSPWGHKEPDTTEQLILSLSVKAYTDVSWIYLHEMSLAQTVVFFKVWILTIL